MGIMENKMEATKVYLESREENVGRRLSTGKRLQTLNLSKSLNSCNM